MCEANGQARAGLMADRNARKAEQEEKARREKERQEFKAAQELERCAVASPPSRLW